MSEMILRRGFSERFSKKTPAFPVLILLSLSGFCGCSSANTAAIVTQCVLPSDQNQTLKGHWQTVPAPIAINVASNFSASEQAAIQASAATWNSFFNSSQMITVINPGSSAIPQSSAAKPSSICSDTIISNGTFTGQAVIYKDASWPYTSSPQAIAITTTCPVTSTETTANPLPYFSMAIMELNYQNFFVSGTQLPDMQSIVTHEMGHLLGLGHSCEPNTETGIPNCQESNLPSAYNAAIMFPTFTFDSNGNGQIKRTLQSNDEGRANCLYQGINSSS